MSQWDRENLLTYSIISSETCGSKIGHRALGHLEATVPVTVKRKDHSNGKRCAECLSLQYKVIMN